MPRPNGSARVIYIPGVFCVHPEGQLTVAGQRQLRLSYGFEETARIEEALGYVRQAVDYAEGSHTEASA